MMSEHYTSRVDSGVFPSLLSWRPCLVNSERGLYEEFGDILSELISRIESISMGFIELRVGKRRSSLRLIDVLGMIDDWCRRNGRIFIIALDEAQYLRFSNKKYDLLLAWSIDNLSNIFYVLTGSEVGLLHDFLKIRLY
ncbi:MAG: hypothetical protein ACO2OS_03620 [Thermosphaera aggregans]|uniref:hypothetical protein n=1 Tax=Thermosphaera aggregans TaxID=54254 RepID=UPI003C0AD1CF